MNITRCLLVASMIITVTDFCGRTAFAGGGCDHCGCQSESHKVCRLVCEEKKVKVTCWGCKCEDFCIPGKSCRTGKNCETVCTECNGACKCDQPTAEPKKFVWFNWEPGCAHIDTKKKLMKKEITVTVPSYKWVVEDLCGSCEAKCESAVLPQGVPMPPVPPAANQAQLKYSPAAPEDVVVEGTGQSHVKPVSLNIYQQILSSLKAK